MSARFTRSLTTFLFGISITLPLSVIAEVSPKVLDSLGTPDQIETSIGLLDFKDGAPSAATADKVFDALAFSNALSVYNNSFRGASAPSVSGLLSPLVNQIIYQAEG